MTNYDCYAQELSPRIYLKNQMYAGDLAFYAPNVFDEYICIVVEILNIKKPGESGPRFRYRILANGRILQVVPWKLRQITKG